MAIAEYDHINQVWHRVRTPKCTLRLKHALEKLWARGALTHVVRRGAVEVASDRFRRHVRPLLRPVRVPVDDRAWGKEYAVGVPDRCRYTP